MTTGAYDNPNYNVHQYLTLAGAPAGGAGTAIYCRTPLPNEVQARKVRVVVTAAGTTTGAASGFDIMAGTASVGAVTCSTSAVGSILDAVDVNATIPAGGYLALRSRIDLTVRAQAVVEVVTAKGASWA